MKNIHPPVTPDYRVLLVQEDSRTARQVVRSFSRIALECHHVADVPAVPEVLTKVKPHLIILDNTEDGRAPKTLNLIRHSCHAPVILMTPDVKESRTNGGYTLADEYILKPVEPRLLALRVIAYLRQLQPPEKSRPRKGVAEWLPYGWALCKACGYRGRSESFVRAAREQPDTGVAPSGDCCAIETRHAILACPCCGQECSV